MIMGYLTFPPLLECPKFEILLKVNSVSLQICYFISDQWNLTAGSLRSEEGATAVVGEDNYKTYPR